MVLGIYRHSICEPGFMWECSMPLGAVVYDTEPGAVIADFRKAHDRGDRRMEQEPAGQDVPIEWRVLIGLGVGVDVGVPLRDVPLGIGVGIVFALGAALL
jgi:hypothetical protein